MKKYKAILFDMDGTLVPMDMHEFTGGYFKGLAMKLAKYGIGAKELVDAVWAGTAEMVKNDGSKRNAEAFWARFEAITGLPAAEVDKDCLDFYANEFDLVKKYTKGNPFAKRAVEFARKRADFVVLATNPLFPMVGQETRMRWVGLERDDFDLVTAYEEDRYCKPNPRYFLSICERIGVKPEECLMIGNDEDEDMYAGTAAGMDCYLVTDCRIPSKNKPWNGLQGTFEELVDMLDTEEGDVSLT